MLNLVKTVEIAQNVSLKDEPYVQAHQRKFLTYFEGKKQVTDLGCGHGRFLRLLAEKGIQPTGVEMNKNLVRECRKKGLLVVHSDVLGFMKRCPAQSTDGFFMSHLIEHFNTQEALQIFKAMSKALRPGGVAVIVTPNSRCLGVITQAFWEDPTHVRPYPASLLKLLASEVGLSFVAKGETDMNTSNNPIKNLVRNTARAIYRGVRTFLVGDFFRPYDLYIVFKK